MIIDHMGITVSDFKSSKLFYSKCLAPLGIELIMEYEEWAGFGRDGKPRFWIGVGWKADNDVHIAFSANSREEVVRFHQAALDAGATDNGAPGIRANYHPNYFGAFVFDPNGYNVEAVCHKPE